MLPEDFDATERLRIQHHFGEPITLLVGYLALFADGDIAAVDVVVPLTAAATALVAELGKLNEAVLESRRPK